MITDRSWVVGECLGDAVSDEGNGDCGDGG